MVFVYKYSKSSNLQHRFEVAKRQANQTPLYYGGKSIQILFLMRLISPIWRRGLSGMFVGKGEWTPLTHLTKLRYLEHSLAEKGYTERNQQSIDGFRLWMLTRKTKIRGKERLKGPFLPLPFYTVLTTVRYFLGWGDELNLFPKIVLKSIGEPQPISWSAFL